MRTRVTVNENIDYNEIENFSVSSYILNEFFTANNSFLEDFLKEYEIKYGYSRANYFKKNFQNWKNRRTELSWELKQRIEDLAPKLFNNSQRFHLLRFSVFNEIISLKNKLKGKVFKASELFQEYSSLINRTDELDPKIFPSHRKYFSEEEKKIVVKAIKYLLRQKLKNSFNNVKYDLSIITEELSKAKAGIKKVVYLIQFLECEVILDSQIRYFSTLELMNDEDTPNEASSLKKEINFFLTNEIFKIDSIQKMNEANGTISKKDISILVSNHNDLINDKIISSTNSVFRGKGGSVTINLETKNKTLMLLNLSKKYFLIIVALGGFIISILLISEGNPGLGIGAGFFLLLWMIVLFTGIKELKKEIKDYGKW